MHRLCSFRVQQALVEGIACTLLGCGLFSMPVRNSRAALLEMSRAFEACPSAARCTMSFS